MVWLGAVTIIIVLIAMFLVVRDFRNKTKGPK
jgi:hypothetical protein